MFTAHFFVKQFAENDCGVFVAVLLGFCFFFFWQGEVGR